MEDIAMSVCVDNFICCHKKLSALFTKYGHSNVLHNSEHKGKRHLLSSMLYVLNTVVSLLIPYT